MVWGSVVVAVIALGLAFPVGLGASIFVSEYLTGKKRAAAKMAIELLAGVPSVVYGLLGVAFLRNWIFSPLQSMGAPSSDTLFTGGVLLAIMVLPTMMSFSDDALRCVPRRIREAGWGMGLSHSQTVLTLVLPQAKSGILGAVMLSFGRAIGETIAVFLVIGRSDQLFSPESFSLTSVLRAGQTLTTKLGGSEISIAYGDPHHWSALMALGGLLWIGIAALTYFSEFVLPKRIHVP